MNQRCVVDFIKFGQIFHYIEMKNVQIRESSFINPYQMLCDLYVASVRVLIIIACATLILAMAQINGITLYFRI